MCGIEWSAGNVAPNEIIVHKHSAVGRTEMHFSDEVLAGFRAEAKRLMAEGPRPQRLADAIKKINQGKL